MRNLLIALAAGGATVAALVLPGLLSPAESALPAVAALSLVYFLLARNTFKKVEVLFTKASKHLTVQPPRFEAAVTTLESVYALTSVQFGVRTQVDSQIGVLYFLQKEFKKARPLLERSQGFGHWMGTGMLAVIHYKKKNHDAMRSTLEVLTKRGKKQALAWCLRGYLLVQIGERDAAQKVLTEGVKKTSNDTKVKDALLAVQNNKKIKMRSFKEQWY